MTWKTYLPAPLRNAQVVLSEADIETEIPLPLHGRVDQVLLNKSAGTAYIIDTKARRTARVYLKDIIQMSVYKVILDRNAKRYFGMPAIVSQTGYVRIPSPLTNKAEFIPVTLMTADAVFAMALRYMILKQKGMLARPTMCASTAFCMSCEVRLVCPRWQNSAPAIGSMQPQKGMMR